MNYIKLLNTLGKLIKEGQIKSIDEAIQMVQKMGAKVDGLLKQGIENLFKTTKAREPELFKGWTPKVIEGGKKEGLDKFNLTKDDPIGDFEKIVKGEGKTGLPKEGIESASNWIERRAKEEGIDLTKELDEVAQKKITGGKTFDEILTEDKGVGNLFKETKKVDLPEGVNWKDTPLPVNPKVESFYDELVENAYKESKKTGRDVREIIEETIDYKFTGNETGKEILDIIEKKFFKADGGRIGYEIGGLTGQAKNIYDSWIAAGHSSEDALDYLQSRGLYNTPVVQQGIMTAPNIINQNLGGDGGDGGGNTITPYDPNVNLGPNKDVIDYEADAYGIGPTFRGQLARLRSGFSKIPTPFNIVKMGIQKAQDWAEQRRIEKEKAEAAAEAALQAQITAQANQTARDLVDRGAPSDWGKTETRSSSGWESSPFKKGGLATMFTRRR